MAGTNRGATYTEHYGTTSPVSGSAPTAVDDGQPLNGLSAITPVLSAGVGITLSGAGTLDCYYLDPDLVSAEGNGVVDGDPVLKLAYDNQTSNFTAADIVYGGTSLAHAEVVSDADAGAAGTLTVTDSTGTFVDNEPLCVPHATADGTLSTNFFLAVDAETADFVPTEVATGAGGATGVVVASVGGGNAQLDYDGQVTDFVLATTVRGVTSHATGVIDSDTDAGTDGTLALTSVTGAFENNEVLGVSYATANGVLSTNFYLAYDNQSGDFTVGQVVTGGTSGATGTIAADVDSGATGVLELTGITGVFQNNEQITDPITGVADVNLVAYKTLSYDAQGTNFIVGQIVYGNTSGATATIQTDTDGGTTGVLDLKLITGTFANDELILVKFALADGIIYHTTAVLELSTVVGTFVNNEAITGDVAGAATVNLVAYKTLNYDAQTVNFSAAQVVYGATSGATATIQTDTDAGTTGTLDLKLITGTFVDNELITVKYALANGALFQEVTYEDNDSPFEVGMTVTGATSGASGTVSVDTGTVLTVTGTGSTLFEDGESIFGEGAARWARSPGGDVTITSTGIRDVACGAMEIGTPRNGRIKWVPNAITFSAGAGGVTITQLGQTYIGLNRMGGP